MTDQEHSSDSVVKYFGLWTGIILIISSIVGSGVYKNIAGMAITCESPTMLLLAWAIAGLVTMLGVFAMAEIAMLLPHSGGTFVYLHRIYGTVVGYAYGWGSFACIQSASAAAIAYVFAESLNVVVALPKLGPEWEAMTVLWIFTPFAEIGVKMAAVALILVLTFLNSLGVKQGGGVSNFITVSVLLSLAVMIAVNFASSSGSVQNLVTNATTYPPKEMGESFGWIKVIFLTMLTSFWAYEGWINLGFVGDEIRQPERNIPKILIFGMLGIIAVYLLVNASFLYAKPIDEFIKIGQTGSAVAAVEVIRDTAGEYGAYAISILIVLTTAGCTNATILTSGRIYYAMAKQGLFFKGAGELNRKSKVPVKSLWMFGLWSCVLVFSGSFNQLIDMLVFAQFIFYALMVAGVFVLRYRMPDAPRPYKTIGYPVVPLLYVLFCVGLIINTVIERPREAGLGLFLIALGTPFYFLFTRNIKSVAS
jgi:basic amino acid/polyamine antiporter, APA family